jgi:hypothetical protein
MPLAQLETAWQRLRGVASAPVVQGVEPGREVFPHLNSALLASLLYMVRQNSYVPDNLDRFYRTRGVRMSHYELFARVSYLAHKLAGDEDSAYLYGIAGWYTGHYTSSGNYVQSLWDSLPGGFRFDALRQAVEESGQHTPSVHAAIREMSCPLSGVVFLDDGLGWVPNGMFRRLPHVPALSSRGWVGGYITQQHVALVMPRSRLWLRCLRATFPDAKKRRKVAHVLRTNPPDGLLLRSTGGHLLLVPTEEIAAKWAKKYGAVWPCSRCALPEDRCQCPSPRHVQGTLEFTGDTSSPIPRYVGLELEVCGIAHRPAGKLVEAAVSKWQGVIKGDGSLPRGGFEIALAPARGVAAERQIKDVCKALAKAGGWVDERAGGHVHVDARGLSPRGLSSLMTLWYLLEATIFAEVAPTRRQNNYCKGWRPLSRNSVHEHLATSDALLYNPQWLFQSNGNDYFAPWDDRYHALNLTPLSRQLDTRGVFRGNTVEFRLFPGTVEREVATRNAILASRLVHCAEYWSRDRIKRAFRANEPSNLLLEIMGATGARMHRAILAQRQAA